jgi:hypothetical protein
MAAYRYQCIEERRGARRAPSNRLFTSGFTLDGKSVQGGKMRKKQRWVELDAQTFETAKEERNRKERGEKLASETPSNRTSLGAAIHEFIESKKRKSAATTKNYTHILNEFLDQTSAKFIDEITSKVIDNYIS